MTNNLSLSLSLSLSLHPHHLDLPLCNRFTHYLPDFRQTPVVFLDICASLTTPHLLCLSGRRSFLSPLARFFDNGHVFENFIHNTKPVSVHPMPSVDAEQTKEEETSWGKRISVKGKLT
ncbi:hypothetical protein CsSME_00015890 [Camellia sinensis var. sinensis]